MRIGFIGLGNMGAPMAANLAAAGHEVAGFDIAGVTLPGLTCVARISDAAATMDVVITMLPDGGILRGVYADIVAVAAAGTLFIDCSTVDVESARAAHAMAADAGLSSIDAPVSGGIAGAAAGTLTFMAGGDDGAMADAAPLFEIMGGRTVHCGPGGSGQIAKICNNMILGISMIGVCESFALGTRLGLNPHKLFDVVSSSSGSCWSVNSYCPVPGVGPSSPADNAYAPGFAAELMLKDLLLAQAAANLAGADVRLGEHAMQRYREFVDNGGRGLDFSALLPRLLGDSGAGAGSDDDGQARLTDA